MKKIKKANKGAIAPTTRRAKVRKQSSRRRQATGDDGGGHFFLAAVVKRIARWGLEQLVPRAGALAWLAIRAIIVVVCSFPFLLLLAYIIGACEAASGRITP